MRAAARSFLLAILILGIAPAAKAQPVPGGGVNILAFQSGSPTATAGGVDVAVTQKATAGYTCTLVVIRLIDNVTGETLDTHTVVNPPGIVIKSFTGLGANRQVQVAVSANFAMDDAVEAKRISAVVTTK